MKLPTLTALEALELAITTLESVGGAFWHPDSDLGRNLQRVRDALNEQRRLEIINQRNRAAIRAMAEQRRLG